MALQLMARVFLQTLSLSKTMFNHGTKEMQAFVQSNMKEAMDTLETRNSSQCNSAVERKWLELDYKHTMMILREYGTQNGLLIENRNDFTLYPNQLSAVVSKLSEVFACFPRS